MKILVLMPLAEQSSFMDIGIYKNLPEDIKKNTFCMPSFMNYIVATKIVPSFEYAIFDSILCAQKLYEATNKDEDLIIIGNMDKKYSFDVVFNFQDLDEDMPYQDNFLNKIKELVAGEEKLTKMVNDMYTNEDSKMALHNCSAAAKFLSKYIKTDPHLDKIKEEYEEQLQQLKDKHNGELN